MDTSEARIRARKARKLAEGTDFYDIIRNLEKAIEALAVEIDVLKQSPSRRRAKLRMVGAPT